MKLTKKEILDGNKLIAKFMGYSWSSENDGKTYLKKIPDQLSIYSIRPENLRYNTHWDWLMPVVEKIEDQNKYGLIITEAVVKIKDISFDKKPYYQDLFVYADDSKIKTVWIAVVDLIKSKI